MTNKTAHLFCRYGSVSLPPAVQRFVVRFDNLQSGPYERLAIDKGDAERIYCPANQGKIQGDKP